MRPVSPTWAVVVTLFTLPDAILADTVEPTAIYAGSLDLLARVPYQQSADMDKVWLDEFDSETLLVEKAASMLREFQQCWSLEDDTPVLSKLS